MKYITIIFLAITVFTACNEIDPKGEKEIKRFVLQWSQTHTAVKNSYLKQDYMDRVQYYGTELTKEQVQIDKMRLFNQFPDYQQTVNEDDISIEKEEGSFLVTFSKTVKYGDKKATFPSFLSLIYKNGEFRILREGLQENAKNQDAPIFPKKSELNELGNKSPRLYGDFNGDGLAEYAYIENPQITDVAEGAKTDSIYCKDGCKSIIYFSNKQIAPITVEDVYNSSLDNLKDLNGDQSDEIGFWSYKPNSKSLYVFDAENNKLLLPALYINTAIHKNIKLIDVIKKSGPNKLRVTESVNVEGKWILQSSVVEL